MFLFTVSVITAEIVASLYVTDSNIQTALCDCTSQVHASPSNSSMSNYKFHNICIFHLRSKCHCCNECYCVSITVL